MAITASIEGGDVQLSGNPVIISCSGGVEPTDSSEYKILLKIISEDNKLEGAPFTDEMAPDDDGNAEFDISGYVDQPVAALFQYPVVGDYVAYETQAFNIQVQVGESYIDSTGELVETWGDTSDVFQILKGGLNPRQISMMNDDNTNFYETYISGSNFLTARPQGDMVHATQHVKLFYMVAVAQSAVTLNIKVVFDDGTEETYTSDSFAMSTDYLYEFNCSPADKGIDLEPDEKQAEHFWAWLDFGEETSQQRYFYFDWKYCERPIFLFFANSLGGIDDVYLSGFIKDNFLTEGEIGTYPYQTDDTVYDPTLKISSRTGQNKWIFNTGWKVITTLQFYRDLMLARQAWYLYSNISQTTFIIIPVYIEVGDYELFDRKDNLYSMELEVCEAHKSAYVFDNRMY